MALDATQPNMTTFQREAGGRVVIKGRRTPIHIVVAHLAIGGELSRSVRRVGRGIVVLQVARNASGGGSCKALGMTLVAGQALVPTVERESGGRAVVERTGFPGGFRVASLALRAEPCSRMHRVGGGIEIFLMAGNASRRSPYKSLRVALDAVQPHVTAIQWKIGACIVVEGGIFPVHTIVTHLTFGGKLSRSVRRIGRGVVILKVTGNTFRTHRLELKSRTQLVALVAIQSCMPSIKLETR